MGSLDRLGHQPANDRQFLGQQASVLLHVVGQRRTVEILHDDERTSAAGVRKIAIAHADDRRVIQLLQQPGLAEDIADRPLEPLSAKRLNHQRAAGVAVLAQKSDPEAAAPRMRTGSYLGNGKGAKCSGASAAAC